MLRIKRLYSFIIQTFFPVFVMTFVVCLFVLLLQFLWKAVEDLVGKGLDNLVLIELFLYAGLNLIPLALPLAILLASLMAFGNMGERLELLAIKAAGVSLLKAMRPLIIFIGLICIGAFFFQNEAMPRIQVKFRSLYISVKQKSPELDIPEGAFYSGIRNYNIYVKKKNPVTSMLYNMMIYDTSEGFDNMSVFVCDSAHMSVSDAKDHLKLKLFHGQRFANFKQADLSAGRSPRNNKFTPYSRENFRQKTIIIKFDSDFSRMDESNLDGTQIAKNIFQLSHSIDSMTHRLDSMNFVDREAIHRQTLQYPAAEFTEEGIRIIPEQVIEEQAKKVIPLNFDSLLATYDEGKMVGYMNTATSTAESIRNKYSFDGNQKASMQASMRQHKIEWHRKFVLSFACLIFFFIGAPLGAIIRKGGLGLPVVISVLLFIVYYVIDNVGYKMARDGLWPAWQGMWLSSFVLFPLGVFLTYKAMNDSALFNTEAYSKNLRKLLGIKTRIAATSEIQIIDITSVRSISDLNVDPELVASLRERDDVTLKDIVRSYKEYNYDASVREVALAVLKEKGSKSMDVASKNWDYDEAGKCYKAFSLNGWIAIACYVGIIGVFALTKLVDISFLKYLYILAIGAYTVYFTKALFSYFDFYNNIETQTKKKPLWRLILLFLLFIFLYKRYKENMKKELYDVKS